VRKVVDIGFLHNCDRALTRHAHEAWDTAVVNCEMLPCCLGQSGHRPRACFVRVQLACHPLLLAALSLFVPRSGRRQRAAAGGAAECGCNRLVGHVSCPGAGAGPTPSGRRIGHGRIHSSRGERAARLSHMGREREWIIVQEYCSSSKAACVCVRACRPE
jgi:hypothetical protein